jgi:Iron-dependent Transcriptional regulator
MIISNLIEYAAGDKGGEANTPAAAPTKPQCQVDAGQGVQSHDWITSRRRDLRGGGLRLAKAAASISVGDVVRAMEEDFGLVECFRTGDTCCLTPVCRLRGVFHEALQDFLRALERRSLAELVTRPKTLLARFDNA